MKTKILISVLFGIGFCGCVTNTTNLEQQISILRQNNRMLEEKINASGTKFEQQAETDQKLLNTSAELYAAIARLQEDLRVVSGKVEEADYSFQQNRLLSEDTEKEKSNQVNRVEEIARSNKDRIIRLEQYLDYEVSPKDIEKSTDPKEIPVSKEKKVLTEAELYEAAKVAFDSGQFEAAREKFQQLLKQFPKSEKSDNAQFWIGEIYFREKWYEKAIMEYQKVIENYPDGNKVPASLLKQGLSFFNLDEKANARLILQEMINKYPASNEAKIAKDKLKTFE
jgi:tol-pal system protein YbgF